MMITIAVQQTAPMGAMVRISADFQKGFEREALNALDAAYKEAHDRITNEDR